MAVDAARKGRGYDFFFGFLFNDPDKVTVFSGRLEPLHVVLGEGAIDRVA